MVARPQRPRTDLTALTHGVFARWRRALDALLHPTVRTVRTAPALTCGLAALAAGTLAAGTLSGAPDPVTAWRAALGLPLWAAVRLVVFRIVSPGTVRVPRGVMVEAWAWSLLPFVVAVGPWLHAAAFVASAGVCALVLRRRGAGPREAVTLTAWVYGFQVAAVATVWLARNVVLAGRIILPA